MEKVMPVILYIGAFELPNKNAAAHRVIGNSKVLEKLGYEVYLAGFETNKISTEIKTYKSTSIKYFSLKRPISIFSWIKFIFNLNGIIKKVDKKVDTIVAYDFPSIGLLFLYVISKFKDIRLVGDCTEWYDIENNTFFGVLKKLDVALRMKILNKYLSGLIVISDYLYNYYVKYNKNVIKIPPLVDLSEEIWAVNSVQNDCTVFTYAGIPFSLTDKNIKDRIDLVITSFHKLSQKKYSFKLKIIGCDLDMFLQRFPSLQAEVKSIEKNIIFLGKLSHREVLSELMMSDFSIFIRDVKRSTKAGFPTKYVEAISCGVPVITNENSNLKNYLIDNYNGFYVEISSPDSMSVSLERVLNINIIDLAKMKENVIGSNTFDYNNYIDEFKKLF